MRGVWKDLLEGVPVAAGLGIVQDFAETKVNPSFVGADVAPLGWGLAAGELTLGLLGAVISHATKDETWFEIAEPGAATGVKDLTAAITHTVRKQLLGSKAPQTQAPAKVLATKAQAAPAAAPRAALAEDF
jgi:hypothetical protein